MGRGFGIAANVDHAVVREVAKAAEEAGYSSFWVNDFPGGDGLAALGAAASVTDGIGLGVGVVAVNRRPAENIIADVRRLDLPQDRLLLGIGSGVPKGALAMVRENTAKLHEELESKVIVAALGPKMCATAGEVADGVLLNWIMPNYTVESVDRVRKAAELAGRESPLMMAYVRCGLLPEAEEKIMSEAERYASNPNYGRHFERQSVEAHETVVRGAESGPIQNAIAEYETILDETVVRAITPDDEAATILRLLNACAP